MRLFIAFEVLNNEKGSTAAVRWQWIGVALEYIWRIPKVRVVLSDVFPQIIIFDKL